MADWPASPNDKQIRRELLSRLERSLRGSQPFLQVVVGPRQVGKTTAVQQLLERWKGPHHYASADLPAAPDSSWLMAQWELALARPGRGRRLLVLDEVQKITRWSEVIKALFGNGAGA
jgi:predicted AAA+ superfamily ATPase